MDADSQWTFIVVGGGCIGASTVNAVIRKWPNARLAWYSGTHEHAASNDFIKIIRDAYPDSLTSQFASQALQMWKTYPYRDYFHKTGWIQAISKDTKNTMTKGQNDEALTTAMAKELVGSTAEPILDEGEVLYLNRDTGYADSALAVQALSKLVVERGVCRYEENVARLVIEGGRCVGVEAGGVIVKAENTVVSVGAWTPSLLEKSNLRVPPGFFKVAGVGVGVLPLSEEESRLLKTMPILVTKNGEVMLSQKENVLKITTTKTFQIKHPDELPSDIDISANQKVLEKILPQFKGRKPRSFACPDLVTPYQNPIVDYMPGIGQLIIATGGSYHSFKFLPNIGNLVVLRICRKGGSNSEGGSNLEGQLLQRWSWERREGTISVHPNIVPA